MDDRLIAEIKEFILRNSVPTLAEGATLSAEEIRQLGYTPRTLFPVASKSDVAQAETALGFALPLLLKRLFLEISNGIAGFAYDITGLEGGCTVGTATLVEIYNGWKTYDDSQGKPWKPGLLPFCHWGSTIFSCVDCTDSSYSVFTFEDGGVWPEGYALAKFFEMWLKGKVEFSQEGVVIVTREGKHPLTGEKMILSARRRKKPRV
jgi:hypothetical protein